ncbi:MAG: CapA family protein [Proteobacteria bacterium]|nr:CapA family protein [Pseudomonadota bacterium]
MNWVRYGWSLKGWYGQFVTVAASIFALTLLTLTIFASLIARYQGRVAEGDIAPPALRTIAESDSLMVLGANIGDVPDTGSVKALAGALKSEVKDLPWKRALVRRSAKGDIIAIDSIFFPVNSISDAFALCKKLAAIPPGCAPVVASSDELSRLDGGGVTRSTLASFGVAPYEQGRERTKIVMESPPPRTIIVYRDRPVPAAPPKPAPVLQPIQTASLQPVLKIQPGIAEERAPIAEQTIWLSTKYKANSPGVVSVVAAGDVMMGSRDSGLNPNIKPGVDVASLVGDRLAALFRGADIAFANLEGPLYDGNDVTLKACATCFAFRGPTYYAGVLANLGIDAVSLANNHSGDYGEPGRNSTIAALRANGIAYAGLDRDDARASTLILANGRRAAVIAFAPNNGTLNLNDIPRAAALVRDLKKHHALVIVSFHGGAEGWSYVHVAKTSEFFVGENRGDVIAFSHAVIDAGADLVIGQGPHVPRAVEIYRGHLIAYSLGNFWTYTGVMTYAVSGLGPVLQAWLAPDGTIAGFTIHSTRQAGLGVPRLDPLDEAARYVFYLTKSDFPATSAQIVSTARAAAPGS